MGYYAACITLNRTRHREGEVNAYNAIKGAAETTEPATLLAMGLLGGLAIGASAWFQGKVGALAADAMGETGKGFGIFIMVVGIIETVALLGLVFFMQAIR